jgi:succinylarginine dihydrolase
VQSHREYNFDGIVGPTHNYGGLSLGNVASMTHEGTQSNPRLAALEGLAKMRFVHSLGVGQAVLPPHDRPSLGTLRKLGFRGSDEEVLAEAAQSSEHLVRLVGSAASMWTANAATVAPSTDTADGRVHITPANLHGLFHRAIEADLSHRMLRAIFAEEKLFDVHEPLPGGGHLADEGAANHLRLSSDEAAAVHLFAWGRASWGDVAGPKRFPARQTREASLALARLHRIDPSRALFPQQHPRGIDAGAFHTDVLAVGNGSFLMLHELAFLDGPAHVHDLRHLLGPSLRVEIATESELPIDDAVESYAFNSQILTLEDGSMILLAPQESRENDRARAFVDRVLSGENPVRRVEYWNLRQSMHNGGGPACLRLRIPLAEAEVAAVRPNVFFGEALDLALTAWVKKHYRDRLGPADLSDPLLMREGLAALDELTQILALGSLYDFQR